MKLVVISDLHADRDTLGVPRFGEVEAAVKQAVGFALEEEVDLFVCLGDIADPETGGATFRSQALTIETAITLARADIPSIWIAGNHDVYEDGTGATTLTPLAAVERAEALSTGPLPTLIHVAEGPRYIHVGGHHFLCLPYTPISHAYEPHSFVRAHLENLNAKETVVLGHLMIAGVVPGEETTEMPRGRDVAFPIEDTRDVLLRMNGHYHHRQTTADGIIIPGSLCRFTFADENHEPGFLAIELP